MIDELDRFVVKKLLDVGSDELEAMPQIIGSGLAELGHVDEAKEFLEENDYTYDKKVVTEAGDSTKLKAGQIATRRTVESVAWCLHPGVRMRQDASGTSVIGGHVETEVLLHDVIELGDDGRFLLHGRTLDLVNIGGKRTSLASLNYHLNSITGVGDGVFLMPDEAAGAVTRLTAFVVAPGLSSKTVMNALRQRIDPVFLPRPLCLVDALPRNDTGKLPRQALQQLFAMRGAKVIQP